MNVFIWGWDYLVYDGTGDYARNAIQNVIGKETNVNFHIYTPDQFETLCLNAIKQIKEEMVGANITTTLVTRDKITMSFEEDKRRHMADGFDDVVLCPDCFVASYSRVNYYNLRRKIRKWAYSFVDTMLVCFYPTLNFREIDELESVKNRNIKVINIYNKRTEKQLQELLEELDPIALKISLYRHRQGVGPERSTSKRHLLRLYLPHCLSLPKKIRKIFMIKTC